MEDIIKQLAATGPMGLFCAFLIWERRADRAERLQVDKDTAEANKALAASLATLAATIQSGAR